MSDEMEKAFGEAIAMKELTIIDQAKQLCVLRVENDRLRGMVRDLTRERDYLKWAADEHLAALDEDDAEGLAEIHEVEVPNDDEVVSYGKVSK